MRKLQQTLLPIKLEVSEERLTSLAGLVLVEEWGRSKGIWGRVDEVFRRPGSRTIGQDDQGLIVLGRTLTILPRQRLRRTRRLAWGHGPRENCCSPSLRKFLCYAYRG